jgi:hypothetical protein
VDDNTLVIRLLLLLHLLLLQGYAFCEFSDPRVIPQVINGLHMHVRRYTSVVYHYRYIRLSVKMRNLTCGASAR